MPASTRRRPKRIAEPKRKSDVPDFLSKAYGITFKDGEPDVPGWGAAISRAETIIEDLAHAWLEQLANLSTELASARTPAQRKSIEQKIRKGKRALRAGTPFPHVERNGQELWNGDLIKRRPSRCDFWSSSAV